MPGPILEKVKEKLDIGQDLSERIAEDSPLIQEYQEELGRRVPNGGGCCGATEVAEQMRREQRYD